MDELRALVAAYAFAAGLRDDAQRAYDDGEASAREVAEAYAGEANAAHDLVSEARSSSDPAIAAIVARCNFRVDGSCVKAAHAIREHFKALGEQKRAA